MLDSNNCLQFFKIRCYIVGCLATSSQNVASILRSPWLTKPTGKMDLMNAHFDEVGYHQEEIKLVMNTSLLCNWCLITAITLLWWTGIYIYICVFIKTDNFLYFTLLLISILLTKTFKVLFFFSVLLSCCDISLPF
jgi:hypothetical protein